VPWHFGTHLGIESERGIAVIEYGMIAGLIAVVILTAMNLVDAGLPGWTDYLTGHASTGGN
jgi:Flp pilus assembly pilin Flp